MIRRTKQFNNPFNKSFEKGQKRFNLMFRIVSTIIAISFVAVISFYIFVGVTFVKEVNKNGSVAETIGSFAAKVEKGYKENQ